MVGSPIVEINPINPLPYRPYWGFSSAAYNSIWTTFQVPSDISSATMEVFIWTERATLYSGYANQMRWGFSAYIAARAGAGVGALVGNQTGAATIIYPAISDIYYSNYYGTTWPFTIYTGWRYAQRDSLGTFNAAAGDIVHMEIYRDPTHVDDTCSHTGAFWMADFSYTADS